MLDFNPLDEIDLRRWVEDEKDSTFGEFSMKLAKKYAKKNKFIVVAVDKGEF